MTERGLPLADGAPACPFVAFDDNRDERSSVPDHRHRCYADARPAPRALAHQEAYCLSSAFPVCPTFQDWARREAARSRGGAPTAPGASAGMNRAASGAAANAPDSPSAPDFSSAMDPSSAAPGVMGATTGAGFSAAAAVTGGDEGRDRASRGGDDDAEHVDDLARRNPPRDWAAPPPWLASNEAPRADDSEPPPFLGRRVSEPGQGLAGSEADRLAGGPPLPRHDEREHDVWSSDSRSAAATGAGLAAPGDGPSARAGSGPGRRPGPAVEDEPDENDDARRTARRPRAYAQHLGGPDGPDWERPRRHEAFPTIKSRVGMPAVPRIVWLAGIVVALALALFLLPGILNLGGPTVAPGTSARPSSGSGAGPSASVAPTVPPAPTLIVYTIKKGDNLSKVATSHGITLEELMAANPTIKNPNKISEGQQITIPAPSESAPTEIGPSASS